MMYYLPLDPYHRNLTDHWRKNSSIHLNYDLWSWIEESYGARVTNHHTIENNYWQFEREEDLVNFVLRWA